ncbi:MAG TPA: DUF3293 domain-containing protein [Gemmatimonadales bacterium]|nr:DUF3293 domain-containing protein [Gemmatimonadales bacterium]
MRPEDDPSWASYARTILEFRGTEPVRVDLARPIGPRAQAAFLAAGLPGCFGLVTPENPRGTRADPEANARRWHQFRQALPGTAVPVDGLDPDSAHRERGVGLGWPRSRVLALARQWEQSAIYWFDGHAMWVIGALTRTVPWRLGGGT